MRVKSLSVLFIAILMFLVLGIVFWEINQFYRSFLAGPPKESQASQKSLLEKEPPYLLDEILVKFAPGVKEKEIPEIIDSLLKEEKTYQISSNVSGFHPLNKVEVVEIEQSFPPTKTLKELEEEIKKRFPNASKAELEARGISAEKAYEIQLELGRWYRIKLSAKTDPKVIANNLLRDPRIEEATPNYKASAF
jgi:flagellar assembly factor FliW